MFGSTHLQHAPARAPVAPVVASAAINLQPRSRQLTYRFSRNRIAIPIIIARAMLAILVNEVTYRNSVSALSSALAVPDGSSATPARPAARAAIDETLRVNRITVTALILLGAAALCVHARYLRMFDQERSDREVFLEKQVRERTAELAELAGYLLIARDDEKSHLARELHDELGGTLTAAKLDIARMRARLTADPWMMEVIQNVNQHLSEGIALKRRIVEDLCPSSLALLGLTATLAALCAEAAARLEIDIRTDFDEVRLTPDGHLAVYRLVQEALTNVGKYARASSVSVSVKNRAGLVQVRIEDDGVGFNSTASKSATHGIAGMRFRMERLHGSMAVASRPGSGTKLEAILPSALTA